jgi:putative hemolysin
MKKILLYVILILAVVVLAIVIIRLLTPEDTWLCQDGGWVKHGHPAADKPATGCGACTMEAKICPDGSAVGRTGPNCEFAPCPGDNVGMANPASVNCLAKGGTISMGKNKKGEYGVCLFEDNRQCEEWALLRGDCPVGGLKITGYESEAQAYCAITGGTVEGLGTATPMCKRVDGTLCTVQANFDGDCPNPYDPNPSAGNREAE